LRFRLLARPVKLPLQLSSLLFQMLGSLAYRLNLQFQLAISRLDARRAGSLADT
jgi:hypothetical protein